jgi:hypothetical protein
VTAFQDQVAGLAIAYPALSFFCTGPWPAYNFVGADLTGLDGPAAALVNREEIAHVHL